MSSKIASYGVFILALLLPIFQAFSQITGIRGGFYTTPAWNTQKGDVTIRAHSRFYHNSKSFYKGSHFVNSVSYWDIQSGFNVVYSLGKNYQIALSQILYQDNHKSGSGYNLPDDLTLEFKAADYFWKFPGWKFGGKATLKLPLASQHNIILEPYSSGKVTLGLFGMASYSRSINFPEDELNFHANLGLIDHNDHGVYWYNNHQDKIYHKHNSREILAAVSAVYPFHNFEFCAELLGNYFLTKPPATVFSRHSYLYLSPSVGYLPFYWLSLAVGMDLRISPNRSSSSPAIEDDLPAFLPTYPTWRFTFSASMNLSAKLQNRIAKNKKEEEKPKPNVVVQQENIYEKIASEKKHIEQAEMELMQLIEKRKQMDEILARLKKALAEEEEKNNKKKKIK